MKSKNILFIIIPLLILLLLIGAELFGLSYYINNVPSVKNDSTLGIKKGEGLRAISRKLERNAVIANGNLFILYVVYEGLQDKLKAGEYEFKSGSTMFQVVEKLSKGDVVVYTLTIPEGLTVSEIGELLQENNIVSKDEFLQLTHDKEVQSGLLGEESGGFEGYLFPDTYSYNKGVTALELINMMVKRFNTVYSSLENERADIELTDNEIITLASIIEKETGAQSERGLISAVFHNRLRIGMKLDSDPTVIYGLGERFGGRLRKRDLVRMTEYNTYLIKGLPPGPIANPGRESISAALNPADVDYLYFVSKGDGTGTHSFSSNYEDHRRAVRDYRKNNNP